MKAEGRTDRNCDVNQNARLNAANAERCLRAARHVFLEPKGNLYLCGDYKIRKLPKFHPTIAGPKNKSAQIP